MGVPKFYRWISERYPCLSEVVKEFQLPEFDSLYLDMNGIIHVCSHPEDDNPHFRITEEKIFTDVSHYIEFLFRMIKPRRCFFMAIDGVAPRAKMNQQRGRRFRSAREAEELEKRAREKGEILPSEKRFDSNCITPGTPFMARLQDYLKYFVAQKISTDPLWQNVKVILSGHETPGEGEHKVMDYIRYQKASPNYDPNTRHCLYGLDADLMMLGLLTHEPHFCLLREEVRFAGKRDKNKRPATPEETTFHLLHLSLMREYLDFEFASLKEPGKLGFEYDLERVIDDWVLMGFLVGNDFIPHLPHLHIHHDGLPLLWKTYINVLPQLDGYLNDGGRLNLPRFEKFVTELAKYDTENFRDSFSDLKWLEGKVGKRKKSKKEKKQERRRPTLESGGGNQFEPLVNLADEEEEGELNPDPSKAEDTNGEGPSVGDLDDDDTFDSEFRMHKDNYYMTKMDYVCVTPEVLKEQATEYVRAIQWILLYYFEGVPSWSWFYPYHYAPYMSDLRDFADLVIEFDLSRPFLPFQQLMAVLPAASKEILPKPYQALMTEENSAIVDFYPVNFSTDLNGKLQEWEAVVLIPFIDEKRLLDAMEPINAVLTDEEKARNRHGPHRLFEYSKDVAYEYTSPLPELFPDIILCKARCTEIPMFEFRIPSHQLYKGLPSGVRLDVYFPGFPTMKYLPHKAELKKAGVRVFQMNSRNDNMIVRIIHETEKLLTKNVAQDLLGNTIFVGWPHLIEAKVVEVSDGEVRCKLADSGGRGQTTARQRQVITERMSEGEAAVWSRDAGGIKERLYEKRGMEIGRTAILIRVLPMMGRKYVCTSHGQVTLEKQWAVRPVAYALQNSVKDIAVHDASYTQFTNLEELFCPRTPVFMLGWPHYGCQGEVLDVDSKMEGRIRVSVTILQEPALDRIQDKTQSLSMQYMPGYMVAQRVGINSHLLSRITGTIFVARGNPDTHNESDMKTNIGLNLKFNKRNEEVPGFTKKVENQWQYSAKALEVVAEYVRKFPAVFEYISCQERGSGPDFYFEDDIFHSDGTGSLKAVADFLKTLPCSDVKPMKVGADIVDELVITEIEREVERIKAINKKKRKSVKMQVKPHLLFRPIFLHAGLVPDPHTTFQLFDRVVSVREGFSVPFGLRGTIIGVHQAETDTDTIYEVVFDAEFVGGITLRCSPGRGYRCSANAIINISHGERKEKSRQNPSGPTTSFTSQQGAVRSTSKGSNSSGSGSWVGRPENSYSSLKNSSSNSSSNRSFGNQNVNNRYGTQTSGSYSMLQTGNHGPGQRGYSQERPPGKSTEFADMWKELQGSTEAKSPRTNPTISLSEAANALPQNSQKTAKNQINQRFADMERQQSDKKPEHPSPSQSTSMTKIDLQSLFGQASSVQQTEKSGNEFAAMLNSLEISAAQKSDGSVVFQRSPSTEAPKDVTRSLSVSGDSAVRTSPITPSSSQLYGRQLSVQELFAGAKQSSTAAPSQPTPVSPGISTSGKSADDSHPTEPPLVSQSSVVTPPDKSSHPSREDGAPQQAAPLPVNPLLGLASLGIPPPGMTPPTAAAAVPPSAAARNPVMGLLEFAKSAGLPPPVYDYVTQQKGQIRAYVTLGTGQKFHGSVCRTREEAAESAASMTLRQMDKLSMNMMMMGGPRVAGPHNPGWGQQNPAWRPQNPAWRQRPNLHFSPNSAFSPVNTKQPMFTGVPFPPGSFSQPPPNFIGLPPGHFPPPRALGRGYDVNHPQGNIAKPSLPEQTMAGDRSSVNRESAAAGTSNPFVPLQVTMKQKSPQKPTSSSTRASVEKGENSTRIAQPTAVPTRPESSSTEVERKPQTLKPNSDSLAQGVKKIPSQADAEKEKSKKQPKRTKSRLAANFNFPN